MSFNLDDLFETKPQQQQQQRQQQNGGLTYVPPPPPPDDPPPPVYMQQDMFGMNAAMQPVEAASHVPYQSPYSPPSHVPQSYGGNGYTAPPPSLPYNATHSVQAAYHSAHVSSPQPYGSSYQTPQGVSHTSSMPQIPQHNAAMPFVPPPPHSDTSAAAAATVSVSGDSKDDSVLAQEEEDRKQLEKVIQLRKELEKERELERKKREELETWGCPTCTYRNALSVNRCEMCDSCRPGYQPPPNVAPPSTVHSSTYASPQKTAGMSSGLAGPTAWVCDVCFAPNEANQSHCKVCNAPEKKGTHVTGGGNTRFTGGMSSGVTIPPSAWMCSVCGKKNAVSAARCVDCGGYQKNGTPVVDPTPAPQPVAPKLPTTWTCSVCTLENSVSAAVCTACESGQRPRHLAPPHDTDREKKKSRAVSRESSVPKTWPCPTCTYENAIAREKCEMCSAVRPLRYKPPTPSKPKPNTAKEADAAADEIQWQDDEVARECNRCHLPFTVTRRRHHCRACGFVFCGPCSSYEMVVKKNGQPERVCICCYEANK